MTPPPVDLTLEIRSNRGRTMHNGKRPSACLVCGHPLFANGNEDSLSIQT